MKISRLALSAALAIAACGALVAPGAMASDSGTITFTGKIIGQTCNVSGNGGNNDFTVILPVVQTDDLASSAATAGATAFSLALSNCPTTPGGLKVGTQFYSASNTDTTTGTLKNTTGPTYAQNVDVQLLDSNGNPVTIGTAAPTDNSNVTDQTTLSGSTATLDYTAQYYATDQATAGLVSTTVEYTLNYQ